MALILKPPVKPYVVESTSKLFTGAHFQYEQKWDGFSCLAFKDGEKVHLQSRNQNSLTSKFPEVADAFRRLKLPRVVVHGELMVMKDTVGSYSTLQQRKSSGERAVERLAQKFPAQFISFDLLVDSKNRPTFDTQFELRRRSLEQLGAKFFPDNPCISVTPATRDPALARKWMERKSPSIDGIVIKDLTKTYKFGERSGVYKLKSIRTIDCVVGGVTFSQDGIPLVFHLGLYGVEGGLHYVASCDVPPEYKTPKYTKLLQRAREGEGFIDQSKTSWTPIYHFIVVEVSYKEFRPGRLSSKVTFVRIRDDKSPRECGVAQLVQ